MPRPFNVFWDADSAKYFIFAPPGCVLVGGVAVEIAGADSDLNVELPFQNDLPQKLYAHVTADEEATGGYKVEFDGNPTKQNATYDFCVASFGTVENDGGQYDMCTSVVSLGTATPDPDDVSIEVLEGDGESRRLQIKGFDLEHEEELADVDIPTLLGLPVNACASSETLEAQTFFLAKRQIPSPSSSSSSSSSANEPTGKSLEYLPPRKVNMRPLLFNKVKQCDFVANGDDTDIEIYVPSLMPAPESGITIATEEDSEGYPMIIIGYEGGGGGGGSSTTGYSSSKHSGVYVPDMSVYSFRYSEHNLQVKYCREVWEDGLLKSRAIDSSWTTVTTAVEESVCHCGSSDGGQDGGSSQS